MSTIVCLVFLFSRIRCQPLLRGSRLSGPGSCLCVCVMAADDDVDMEAVEDAQATQVEVGKGDKESSDEEDWAADGWRSSPAWKWSWGWAESTWTTSEWDGGWVDPASTSEWVGWVDYNSVDPNSTSEWVGGWAETTEESQSGCTGWVGPAGWHAEANGEPGGWWGWWEPDESSSWYPKRRRLDCSA